MQARVGKRAKSVIGRDGKVIITTARGEVPFVADRGDGDYAYDIDGRKFLDFSSFISVYNLGVNANKEVRAAVKGQVDRLMHAAFNDYYSELPVTFAENLVKMMPGGFGKVFYSNSGTEANEAALKFSKFFTKRQYTLAFYGAFHGRTMGSLSLTASKAVQREHFGPFNSAVHAPYAYCYRCPFGKEYPSCGMACVDHIKKQVLSKEVAPREVSSIFMEPIQGEGGYIVPPKEFVYEMRKLADDNGILLVSDEVQAGYMRTGKFLALDNFGVKADIYTMAKSVGGGLPMGVTITRRSLGDIPSGAHSNTFGGNLVAVAAAQASLSYLNSHRSSLEHGIRNKGAMMMRRLNQMKERYEIVGDVRGIGLMIGVEFVKSKKSKEPAIKERDAIIVDCFNNGMLLLPAGVSTIRLIPPLTMSDENIGKGLDILEDAIRRAGR
ncbi:MAG TPA: aminotransferase class III-fold pyridoxal phosphate-dependent enzyme [Candidatus Saccharimonadales bacterium]|nr:aminotransferase class III-fold pyridoxal phosphate-dependent enzyme [Candidatus Saccharimonadales bacterium]